MQTEEYSSLSGSKFIITICAMLGSLMAVLDISIVNVALNDIRSSFSVGIDQIAWVSTGYMMANVIVIPLTGWFQKRLGLVNYYVISLCIFTCASLLCGLSWNLESMTFFRILQGVGGGAIIPTASTILIARYPRKDQGMAQAFIGLGAISGPLLGPSLGGYLIDIFSWHMIFLINIPFGILAISIAVTQIKEKKQEEDKTPFALKSFLLLAAGLGSLQFILEEGHRKDWLSSYLIIFLIIISISCLVTLVVDQLETEKPMIDFRVFANRNYLFSTLLNAMLGVNIFGVGFLLSLFCSTVLNYTPLHIGTVFLQGASIQIIVMPLMGKLIPKVDNRLLVAIGLVLVLYSLWLNSHLTENISHFGIVSMFFIRAVGMSCIFIPLSMIAMGQIETKNIGNAVGLFNLTRELGGSIGLAWMASYVVNNMKIYDGLIKNHLNPSNSAMDLYLNSFKSLLMGKVTDADLGAVTLIQQKVSLQASVLSFNRGFLILSFLFASVGLLLFFMKKVKSNEAIIKDMH